jgi:hypothetical protein
LAHLQLKTAKCTNILISFLAHLQLKTAKMHQYINIIFGTFATKNCKNAPIYYHFWRICKEKQQKCTNVLSFLANLQLKQQKCTNILI